MKPSCAFLFFFGALDIQGGLMKKKLYFKLDKTFNSRNPVGQIFRGRDTNVKKMV